MRLFSDSSCIFVIFRIFVLSGLCYVNDVVVVHANYAQQEGSFNSFRNQVGFCKLQGFDTISRSTSCGPKAFVLGTIWIGVGMNDFDFQHDISNCGRCLWVEETSTTSLSYQLDTFDYTKSPTTFSYVAMIMDECQDEICKPGFLDFDIYSELQPVKYGNPSNISWSFIPCPVNDSDIQLLFCFSNTCHEHDPCNRTVHDILKEANPYFFSVFVRNSRLPISSIEINETFSLQKKEGWFWNFGYFDFTTFFTIELFQESTMVFRRQLNLTTSFVQSCDYRGGLLSI